MRQLHSFFAALGILGWTFAAAGQSTQPGGTYKSQSGWEQLRQLRSAGTSTGNTARPAAPDATSGIGSSVGTSGQSLRLGGTPISPSGQELSPPSGDGSYRPWSWRYGSFGAEDDNRYEVGWTGERYIGNRYGSEGEVYRSTNSYNLGYSGSNRNLNRYDTGRSRFDRYERDGTAGQFAGDRSMGDTRRGPNEGPYLTPDNLDRSRSFNEAQYGSTYDRQYGPGDERREMDNRWSEDNRWGPDNRYASRDYEGDSYANRDSYARNGSNSGPYDERAASLDLGRRSRSMNESDYRDTGRNETLRNRGWRNLGGPAGEYTGGNRALGEDRRTAATTNRPADSRDWNRSFGRDQGDWGTRAARRMRGFNDSSGSSSRDYRSNWDNRDQGRGNEDRWSNDNSLGNRSGDQWNRGRAFGNRSGDQGSRGRAFGNRSGDQGNRGRAFGNRSGDQQGSYRDEMTTR